MAASTRPLVCGATRLGKRTTRLTVIDDTPASLATAESVGAECGSLDPMVLIRVRLGERKAEMHDSACLGQMTALSFSLIAQSGEARNDFGAGCTGLSARRRDHGAGRIGRL